MGTASGVISVCIRLHGVTSCRADLGVWCS